MSPLDIGLKLTAQKLMQHNQNMLKIDQIRLLIVFAVNPLCLIKMNLVTTFSFASSSANGSYIRINGITTSTD